MLSLQLLLIPCMVYYVLLQLGTLQGHLYAEFQFFLQLRNMHLDRFQFIRVSPRTSAVPVLELPQWDYGGL